MLEYINCAAAARANVIISVGATALMKIRGSRIDYDYDRLLLPL
jgi:hypothetical protein